ncbi:LysR substrate-binding domain-containing protein [Aestuariivita sp.]|uniref:LysR substrate-binding domain-containing protein n=1 Tax=Aestuariivita sp. TaxID=1872407 RepID=UPI00216CA9AD|nr:LysR substrate-binding domain-containing protein [Aestuariivita sp.]MCE8006921.1 LysR family transcriptional regulator [Aestuariivita sp.]
MQRIPSTQALRALESFSRHGAVWKAADELNLTRSAVSHQLRLLERDLGFSLFHRVGTRLELTRQGRSYAADVRNALAAISGSAARNAGRGLSGSLTVSCTPGFASSWLTPKVSRFRAVCPDITLSVTLPTQLDDVTNPNADVFIVFSDHNMAGVETELLQSVAFTPMISPILLNRLGGLHNPEDVLQADLLHLTDHSDWVSWLAAAGQSKDAAHTGVIFADLNLVYTAARHAQGIAMGDDFICREAMETGQLLRPFDLSIESSKSYYLAIPPAKADIPSVVAFRRWILDELVDGKS